MFWTEKSTAHCTLPLVVDFCTNAKCEFWSTIDNGDRLHLVQKERKANVKKLVLNSTENINTCVDDEVSPPLSLRELSTLANLGGLVLDFLMFSARFCRNESNAIPPVYSLKPETYKHCEFINQTRGVPTKSWMFRESPEKKSLSHDSLCFFYDLVHRIHQLLSKHLCHKIITKQQ